MEKKNYLAHKIAEAWGFDNDKQNIFPPSSPLSDMEEAADEVYDVQPRPTLRSRPYGNMPLIIQPKYEGDFLEKLMERYRNRTAADPTNLLDFSTPEEMLKHQEEPEPRDLQDDYYEFNRPQDNQTLKDYHDRGWDEFDSPEMSEDKYLRLFKIFPPEIPKASCDCHCGPDIHTVIAQHLLETMPYPFELDLNDQVRTAKLLQDLEKSLIYTKSKGWRKPEALGVSVMRFRNEPRAGRWSFRTTSGNDTYTTIFQFIPEGNVKTVSSLNVRVSCSCPSFLFWGAQYNAVMGDYFYGKIRPKFTPPKKRDPTGRFLVCKHVLACIPIVSRYRLQDITTQVKQQLTKPWKVEVVKNIKPEKLRIPPELLPLGKKPEIAEVEKKWEMMSGFRQRNFILSLEDPEEVAYFAHRFPETATGYVVQKLKDMALKERQAEDRDKAKELLKEII